MDSMKNSDTGATETAEEAIVVGARLLGEGRWEEASKCVERSLRLGSCMGTEMLRGTILLYTGHRREGIEAMEREIRNYPGNTAAIDALRQLNIVPFESVQQERLIQLTGKEPPRSSNPLRPLSLLSQANCGKDSWGSVSLVAETLAARATNTRTWKSILSFHQDLAQDDYVRYTDLYYRECFERYGEDWRFWDIVNVLYAASDLLRPRNYLEIGVRRGRSSCVVAHACPGVDILAFDIWQAGYANMENPGPDFVRSALTKVGHSGTIQFIDGNSHQTVPNYFKVNPLATFDMITVDGDHTEVGAEQDLMDVIPHLSLGGVVVFDDIAHPAHPYLLDVWRRVASRFPGLSTFEWREAGYGIAFGIKRK